MFALNQGESTCPSKAAWSRADIDDEFLAMAHRSGYRRVRLGIRSTPRPDERPPKRPVEKIQVQTSRSASVAGRLA